MLFTALDMKFPFESGPISMGSPTFTRPEFKMPFTTVPTYGTDLMLYKPEMPT